MDRRVSRRDHEIHVGALLERAFRRPSRTDIDVSKHVQLPDFKSIKVFPVDGNEAQAKRAEFLTYWQGIQSN
ncbi:MAG: hypothetical protein AAB658_02935 [Chloroflexota bacterium]|jgi:iron(III) transport system substrate-binding protein